MKTSVLIGCATLLGLSWGGIASANEDIAHLQSRWAQVNYQLPKAEREDAFLSLASEAEQLRQSHPGEASYLIWEGIIRATYAGAKGGLGALSEVKQAKSLFEQAIAIDPTAMSGSAYTSLGSLYYQVPGWPIGFGDDDEARKLLLQGLNYNPDGIDSNYFYGDFLLQEKEYRQALVAFEKALAAPPRPGRESADAGRRQEISDKMALLRRKL